MADPFLNQVSRLRLSPDLTSGVVEETITSPLFQTPSTVAIHGNRLAAVNAKFDTGFPPTADAYEVVIVTVDSPLCTGSCVSYGFSSTTVTTTRRRTRRTTPRPNAKRSTPNRRGTC